MTLFMLSMGTTMVHAQTETGDEKQLRQDDLEEISGTIIDAVTKAPIPGVRVEALDNKRYTAMTKADGNFSIKIPKHVVSLYVSTPGYESVIIKARQKGDIQVKLYDEAFGTYVKNGFDVTSIGEATTDLSMATTFEEELQKQMGSQVRTVIRSGTMGIGGLMMMQGINSINTSAQPLIVLDGVIQDLQDSYAALHEGFYNNTLAAIDVNDIEKITVLNNATSIYGAKGANGVILIDTKRGHSMATRIDAQAFASYTMAPRLPKMMNAEQYRVYANELLSGVNMGKNAKTPTFLLDDEKHFEYKKYHNDTDWSDYVFQNAWAQNYRVNVQGGDDAAMYNFSLGFADGESTIKANDFNRLNIRFNTDVKLANNLDTRFDISYSRISRDLRDDGISEDLSAGPIVSPGFLSLIKSPFLNPYTYDSAGKQTGAFSPADDFASFATDANTRNNRYANPLAIFKYGDGQNKNNQEYTVFDVTVAPVLTLGKGWTISTLFNYTLHRTSEKYFRPMTGTPNFYIEALGGNSANEVRSFFSKEEEIYSDTRVAWTKKLSGHNIAAFGGFRFSNFAYDSNFASSHNTGSDKLPDIKTGLWQYHAQTDGAYDVWRNMSYYANVDYNFRNKYYLQGSLAAETSSRFGRDTNEGIKVGGVCWGLFPSLQAGWLVSSEDFFNVDVINLLKLTGGIDWSGNDNISNNAAFCYHENIAYSEKFMGLVIGNIENQSIQWETTRRVNVGADLQMFNNRLRLTGNFFHNVTNNLLTLKRLDPLAGLEYAWSNGGSLKNTGAYASANIRVLNSKNWKWEVGAGVGTYKNVVTALPNGESFTTDIYDGTILTAEGQPAGLFYGYETKGVFATTEKAWDAEKVKKDGTKGDWRLYTYDVYTGKETPFEAGDVEFVDQNNDGFITEADRIVIGDPNPDLYGNLFSNLMFKNFTLSATFNYSLGNDVYNYQRALLESGSSFYNQTVAVTNRWKVEGHETDMPKATYGDPKGNNRFSDRWIEDGSYIRLKDVTLSYKVPISASWCQGLTVWASGTNLLTFSKYLGSDPEFSFSNNVLYQGIDNGMLGQSRSFQLGVKINL